MALNRAFAQLLGLRIGAAEGRPVDDLFEAVDAFGNRVCGGFCGLREMTERGEEIRTFPLALKPPGGGSFLRFVMEGEILPSPTEGPLLLLYLRPDRRRPGSAVGEKLPREDRDTRSVALTRRQAEILGRLARGDTATAIAEDLGISIHTVRKHIQACLGKLGATSKAQAVALAMRRGLI